MYVWRDAGERSALENQWLQEASGSERKAQQSRGTQAAVNSANRYLLLPPGPLARKCADAACRLQPVSSFGINSGDTALFPELGYTAPLPA